MGIITVLTDDKNKITKTILDKTPNIEASGHIVSGHGQAQIIDLKGLRDLIPALDQHQCLSMGVVEDQGLDEYPIFSKYKASPGQITRSSKDFTMSVEESFMLFDIDDHDVDQVIEILEDIDPAIVRCGKLVVPSVSSWLWDTDSDEWIVEGKSSHIYIEVTDGSKILDYGQALFKRMIMKDHGTVHVVKTSGAKLLRTMVDAAVWKSTNREIFESDPVCCDGVESRRLTKTRFIEGEMLDISESLLSVALSPEEEVIYQEKVIELKEDPDVARESRMEKKRGLEKRAKRS